MFDFPYDSKLMLPPGEGIHYKTKKGGVMFTTYPISGLTIISYLDDIESWDKKKLMRADAREVSRGGEKMLSRTIYFSKDDKTIYKSGYKEQTNFTQIMIVFEIGSEEELNSEELYSKLQNWVWEVFSDFIYTYKLFSMDNDIKKPRIIRIPMINIYIAKDYEFDSTGYEAEFTLYKQIFQCKDYRHTGLLKKSLKEDTIKNLTLYLKDGFKPELYEKILLDSKEYSILYHEYDMSIILTEVAFEIFIKEMLIEYCKLKGIRQLEIKKGGKHTEKLDYEIAVDKYGISESLDVLSELLANKLKSFKEYQNWHTYAYNKRNSVIHKRKLGYNENDSSKAWLATTKYIELIKSLTLQAMN